MQALQTSFLAHSDERNYIRLKHQEVPQRSSKCNFYLDRRLTISLIFPIMNSKIEHLVENENNFISSTDFKTCFIFFVDLFLTILELKQDSRCMVTYEGISPGKNYTCWNFAEHFGV